MNFEHCILLVWPLNWILWMESENCCASILLRRWMHLQIQLTQLNNIFCYRFLLYWNKKVQILNVIRNVKIMVGVIMLKYVNVQKVANYHKKSTSICAFYWFFLTYIFLNDNVNRLHGSILSDSIMLSTVYEWWQLYSTCCLLMPKR